MVFVIVTLQPPLPPARPMVPSLLPVVAPKLDVSPGGGAVDAVVALYLSEAAKYPPSVVTMVPRFRFLEGTYPFGPVLRQSDDDEGDRSPHVPHPKHR